MDKLRKKLKEEYGVSWSHGWTDIILKDHLYYCVITWNKKQYLHKYLPIISKRFFDQVQQVKAGFNKKRFKYAGKQYFYRGLLRCGTCGLSITPEVHKGHVYYHYTQYNGKHGAEWIREEGVTKQIGIVFKRLQLPEWVLKKIIENLNAVNQDKMDFHNKQYDKLTKKHKTLTNMIDNLYMDRLKGRIIEDEYFQTYFTAISFSI